MSKSMHYIEEVIQETDKISKRLVQAPNCEDTLGEYETTKERLMASLVHLREGLEAIHGS